MTHPVREIKLIPENIPLDIIYEDKDVIIINKPAGMVVHPAYANYNGTLVNALLHHYGFKSEITDPDNGPEKLTAASATGSPPVKVDTLPLI